MNNLLTYKEYKAKVEFDGRDNIFVGRVLGVNEIIVFHGATVKDLKREMKQIIDFYDRETEKNGRRLKKIYSGKVFVRVSDALHEAIEAAAASSGKSINEWSKDVFEKAVKE